MVKRNTLNTWIQSIRPKTLFASIAPIIIVVGALIGESQFKWLQVILLFLIAITAQFTCNVANDYFDYKSGVDEKRSFGPERIITSGVVSPQWMLNVTILWLSLCALFGLWLVWLSSNWWLLLLGASILIGTLAYSAGPYPLAHNGLGDIAVIVFYGLVPVLGGFYAIAGYIPLYLIPAALAIGFSSDNILVVNNYRDFLEDKQSGKETLIVKMGEASGPYLYYINSIFATILMITTSLMNGSIWIAIIGLIPLVFLYLLGSFNIKRRKGKSLNILLGFSGIVSLVLSLILFFILI